MKEPFSIHNHPGLELLEFETIDSTNNFLKKYRPEQESPITLVTAEYQTAGRGQRGNSWESEDGANIVYSLLIHPRFVQPTQVFGISEIAALSVCEGLKDIHSCSTDSEKFSVKWPNDIYYGDKKIAGILIENELKVGQIDRTIIGVGININQKAFYSDAPNPISLRQIIGKESDRQMVLTRVMSHFCMLYQQLEQGETAQLHTRFKQQLYRREGMFPYSDEKGRFNARIVDIEPTGHLILEDSESVLRRYAFKEVSFVIE